MEILYERTPRRASSRSAYVRHDRAMSDSDAIRRGGKTMATETLITSIEEQETGQYEVAEMSM